MKIGLLLFSLIARLLNLLFPDGVVAEYLLYSKTHTGQYIRNSFEEWSRKDVHEANL